MNKFLNKIVPVTFTIAMMQPLSSNAIDSQISFDSNSLKQTLDGFTELDNCDFFEWVKYDRVFTNEDGTHIIGFHKLADQLFFTMTGGVEQQEIVEFVKDKYDSSIIITTNDFFGNYGETFAFENADINTQVSICDSLKENGMITDCRLITQRYTMTDYYGRGVNQYPSWYLKYEGGEPICEENGVPKKYSTIDALSEYIETELESYDLREIKNDKEKETYVELVPPDGTTLTEQVKVATKIANDLQIYPFYECPETAAEKVENGSSIDLFNSVKGDANCDGKATVADSVAILQHIANRDKYGLNAQGLINADVDGEAGVTANDARVLQEWDANR